MSEGNTAYAMFTKQLLKAWLGASQILHGDKSAVSCLHQWTKAEAKWRYAAL